MYTGSMATSWDIYDLWFNRNEAEESGSITVDVKTSILDVASTPQLESDGGFKRPMSILSSTSTGKSGTFIYSNFHASDFLAVIIMLKLTQWVFGNAKFASIFLANNKYIGTSMKIVILVFTYFTEAINKRSLKSFVLKTQLIE